MRKTFTLMILFTALLSGCAGSIKTIEVSSDSAAKVPQERLFAYQEKKMDSVSVSVIRDTGLLGSGCFLAIETDGQLTARMGAGEAATIYLPVGEHELAVAPDPKGRGLCGLKNFSPVAKKYSINADSSNKFRLSSRQYRRPELEALN